MKRQTACRSRPIRRRGIRRPVDAPEVREPGRRRQSAAARRNAAIARRAPRPRAEAEHDRQAEHTGHEREAGVQPRQHRQRCADRRPPGRRERPSPASDRGRPGRARRPSPPPRQPRPGRWCSRAAPPAPPRPARATPPTPRRARPVSQKRRDPHRRHAGGRHADDRGDGAVVPRQRKGRQHQRRDPRGVNRVDLAVDAAAHEVGLQDAVEVLEVLILLMVVLDGEIAVAEQALGDDEVVRLVARRAPVAGRSATRRRRPRRPRHRPRTALAAGPTTARTRRPPASR